MTGAGSSWVVPAPSRQRRRWLRLASATCAAVFLVLLAATVQAPAGSRAAGLIATGVGALLALRLARRDEPACELRLDAAGNLWRRPAGQDEAQRLVAVGLSRWLAVFDGPDGHLCLWRDSLPEDHWRVLCAHLRWHVERCHAAPAGADGSGRAAG